MRIVTTIVVCAIASTLPASAANPLSSLQYLVGTWHCTYVAGTVSTPYTATWSYDLDGNALRQVTSFGATGDEALTGYDAERQLWTTVVLDQHGGASVLQAKGDDPNHLAFRSVYPDTNIAPTFDRVSDTKYTTHASFTMYGRTISSVDTSEKASP